MRNLKILFMDDEEPLRRLGSALLKSLGHEVKIVADAVAALREHEAASRGGRPFDLLILDLTVPGGQGAIAVMEQLASRKAIVKAIVMSGYAGDPVTGDPGSYGFRGVLSKPYRVSDLSKILQRAMVG